jgi:sugar phosphate isomerase/epimerase
MSRLGIRTIELMSFEGCRGNAWGDFGAATDLSPVEIGRAIRDAGLICPSVMVVEAELGPARLASTLEWVKHVGGERVVLSAFATPQAAGLGEWHAAFECLGKVAREVCAAGFEFALHTQVNLWQRVDGTRPADELLRWVDPDLLQIEFDPSGAINYGVDPAAYIRRRPEVFYALHLRDGTRPPQPAYYLPAEPLGEGAVDWRSLLQAAGQSSVQWYFLEMEVRQPELTVPSIQASRDFLLRHGFLERLDYVNLKLE